MAFIDTTPPDCAVGEVRAMYARQQANWGYVPNYAKVFSHRPEVMVKWASLQACIKRNIGARRFELVTFAAARALGNTYCSLAHYRSLTKLLTAEEVRWLVDEDGENPFTPAETAMMRLAAKVVRQASRITAGDVEGLAVHGFTDEEIFDIVATAAGRAFFANLLDGLGVEADRTYLELPERLRRALTVGRPIDFRAPEQLATAAVDGVD
jgi:uncharacterized peroxidase-related enzyme